MEAQTPATLPAVTKARKTACYFCILCIRLQKRRPKSQDNIKWKVFALLWIKNLVLLVRFPAPLTCALIGKLVITVEMDKNNLINIW